MNYKIVEIEKKGLFEIHKQVEKRKLTFRGFKYYMKWERMSIDYLWNGKWIINLWDNIEDAKSWLIEFEKWKNRTNKEEIFNT